MLTAPPKIWTFDRCVPIGISTDPTPDYACSGKRDALLVSYNHFRLPDGSWSGGGPFYCYKRSLAHSGKSVLDLRQSGVWSRYTSLGVAGAPEVPLKLPTSAPVFPSWEEQAYLASSYYATGYARARPGNPVASVGQFLVELRDLPTVPASGVLKGLARTRAIPIQKLPRLLYARLLNYRALGSEYLNIEFGWKPFVSDVRKMYNLWHTIDRRMAQIVRENGRYIRRRATVKNETTVTQTSTTSANAYYNVYGAPPNIFGASGHTVHTVTRRETEKVWFSGSFRYYIPDTGSSLWDARARLALFGAYPTPELLYNVLPWSWLIDWFSNTGDVISNLSQNAVDNLTTRYSFIMRHVMRTVECKAHVTHGSLDVNVGSLKRKYRAVDNSFTSTATDDVKVRVGGGNPFGLGVKLDGLNGHQLGILAALGLSRSSVF